MNTLKWLITYINGETEIIEADCLKYYSSGHIDFYNKTKNSKILVALLNKDMIQKITPAKGEDIKIEMACDADAISQ